MCARKTDPEPEPAPEPEPVPEPKPEPKPAPVTPSEPPSPSPKGKPEPNPLAEVVSKLAAKVADLERFTKDTKTKVEKAPFLGRIVKAMASPDDWMPDFLREPKKKSPQ